MDALNVWRRASLYVGRNLWKSLLLFLIMLTIAALALVGISIQRAAATTELSLRRSLGGSFSMSCKIRETDEGFQASGPVDRKLIDRIMSKPGLSAYNAVQTGNAALRKGNSGDMRLISSAKLTGEQEYLMHVVKSKAQTNPQYDPDFLTGRLKIAEGRNIQSGDTHTAVISKALAALNGLGIGDEIELAMTSKLAEGVPGHANDTVKLKIVGLFEVVQDIASAEMEPPCNLPVDMVLIDEKASLEFYGFQSKSYDNVSFFADDPAKIDGIVDSVRRDSAIGADNFYIDKNYSEYINAAKPLKNMSVLIGTVLLILLVAGAVILCLVLTLQAKGRLHETGMLLSAGISKRSIFAQRVIESLSVAAVAFALAVLTGSMAAQFVCDGMLNRYGAENADKAGTISLQGAPLNIARIDAGVRLSDTAPVAGAGALVALLAAGVSSVPVFTLKPNKILTKME